MLRRAVWFASIVAACTPSNASDAEKKHDVAWLSKSGSSESISALGRLADDDKSARDALEALSERTLAGHGLDGGAAAFDVYLAAWGGVERNASWGIEMMKRALADKDRMNDAAFAMKRGSPQVVTFVPDLDTAMKAGCDVACGSALSSATGAPASLVIEHRLADDLTRPAMCAGLGSQESSKDARAVFVRVPESSRNALSCPGAAARMAARDDEVLGWLAKTAEPGLLRMAGLSDALPCDRLARLWSTAITSRDHTAYGALAIPLGAAIKRCGKNLDATLAGALALDVDSQTLIVAALDPLDASVADLSATCGALPNVARGSGSPPTKARAQDVLAHCKH